jgi:hypothetical protein
MSSTKQHATTIALLLITLQTDVVLFSKGMVPAIDLSAATFKAGTAMSDKSCTDRENGPLHVTV